MDKQSIIQYKSSFDAIASYIEGEGGKEQVEVWFARDLMAQLGYSRWENFHTAINRAVDSCNSLGVNVDDHFREVTKMVKLGSGSEREIQDYVLRVCFDSGEVVLYDVKDDIRTLDDYKVLETEYGLFQNAQLDSSRTCVFWNDRVDLASDTILEYGVRQ